ncbi:hypothetical protein [Phenylobacterium sp.]|uniref:hypothetical protein n=1 Tax=Phenylobacterium sp. TaxID=1871053 RepID=UPI0035AE19EF
MRDALDEQIEAFEALLPQIKQEYGSVWVLVAHGRLIQTFPDFPAAAEYARAELSGDQVLIRHTDEGELTAPFVDIAS